MLVFSNGLLTLRGPPPSLGNTYMPQTHQRDDQLVWGTQITCIVSRFYCSRKISAVSLLLLRLM